MHWARQVCSMGDKSSEPKSFRHSSVHIFFNLVSVWAKYSIYMIAGTISSSFCTLSWIVGEKLNRNGSKWLFLSCIV